MNTRVLPPPPTQIAFRSISECRVRASFSKFEGKKMLIYKHKHHSVGGGGAITEYYLELIDKSPAVITYINDKRVDIRKIRDEIEI